MFYMQNKSMKTIRNMIFLLLLNLVLTRQNAVVLILCRNSDKNEIKTTLENFEQKFNSKFNYPYVFLNDAEWTKDFKVELNRVTRNRAKYGRISEANWKMPPTVDRDRAKIAWASLRNAGVPYADMESYHNMCRFYSKEFYKHPLVRDYEYYWRIEPGVTFHCDIEDDPFDFMKNNNKIYGFTITMHEFMDSIKTLDAVTNEFIEKNKDIIPKNIERLRFTFDERGVYNGCHFWSNFEIASFQFFRSELYNKYVDFLDEKNGFYYERWGDAPVHTIAIAKFVDKSQLHFFENIGYTHPPYTHCPANGKNCTCRQENNFDFRMGSCLKGFLDDVLRSRARG